MKIDLICVGNIKEKFYEDAIKEYSKRLSRYIKLNIIVLKDEKTPATASKLMEDKIKEVEGERILDKIKEDTYLVALDLQGKKYSSEDFAKYIQNLELISRGKLSFVIGGSLGLSKRVLERADARLCFSDMTFPHQLMRIIFLEQVYRGYRIINNEPYHK